MNQHQQRGLSFGKKLLVIFAVLATLVALYDVVTMGRGQAATDNKPAKPISLVGTWHQTEGMPGVTMTAEISGDGIQVNMEIKSQEGDEHGTFWMGSFDTSDKFGDHFVVTSLPDPDAKKAMKGSLFGDDAESSKKYTYDHGDLSFEFSMMGIESTVHMSKGDK
jgi:hypothetical protein